LYEGYLAELRQWQAEFGKDPESLTAMAKREEIDARWEKIGSDLEKAATKLEGGTSDLKKAAEAMLLSSAAGNAALAYEIEHGASPLSAYARHEEPLTAWMMDKLAGEKYAKEHGGEAPSEDWWKARWFKEWYPLEQFHAPGAPIMAPSGPEADEARARLTEQGVGEDTQTLADIWHNEYLARKKLIPPLESTGEKFITLAEATGNLLTAFEAATTRLNAPPPGYVQLEPGGNIYVKPDDPSLTSRPASRSYTGWRGIVHTDAEGTTWYRPDSGKDYWEHAGGIPVPSMQLGGITRTGGLFNLHPNEAVIPLDDLAPNVQGGGGGVAGTDPYGFDEAVFKLVRSFAVVSGFLDLNVEASLLAFDQNLVKTNIKIYEEVWPALDTLSNRAYDTSVSLDPTLKEAAQGASGILAFIAGLMTTEPPDDALPPDGEEPPKTTLPQLQRGGFTGAWSGDARLHPNELVLPLSDRARTNELLNQVTLPGGGPRAGGGGLVIQGLTIPVTVYAPVSERMAREIGTSVAGIGSRLGTQIVRAAQRAGLA